MSNVFDLDNTGYWYANNYEGETRIIGVCYFNAIFKDDYVEKHGYTETYSEIDGFKLMIVKAETKEKALEIAKKRFDEV